MYAVCVCVEGGGGWRVMCVHEFEEVVPSVLHIFWGGGKGGGAHRQPSTTQFLMVAIYVRQLNAHATKTL